MNKRNTLILIFILFLIVLLSGCTEIREPDTVSIPSIHINEETYVRLISVDVRFEISYKNYVFFNAVYVLHNPTNKTINQTILFNFSPEIHRNRFPYIEVNEGWINCDKIKGQNEESIGTTYYPTVRANITILANEKKTLRIPRLKLDSKDEFSIISNTRYVTYESINGSKWNDTIQYANFTIILEKNYFHNLEIEGFEITEDCKKIVATKSFTNWIPEKNIIIKFSKYDLVKIFIIFILIITIEIILGRWYINFKKKGDDPRDLEEKVWKKSIQK
jgi:hypothetical protein